MATYFIKRKVYSAVEEVPVEVVEVPVEKKKGKGKKVALAVVGGLGAAAGGFYAARKGALGTRAAFAANRQYINLGKAVGSKKMMNSGFVDTTKAAFKHLGEKPSTRRQLLRDAAIIKRTYMEGGSKGFKEQTAKFLKENPKVIKK